MEGAIGQVGKAMRNTIKKAIEIFSEEGLKAFVRKIMAYMVKESEFLILPYALLKIEHLAKDSTLNELIDFSFNALLGLIKPIQLPSEILGLLRILAEIKPKTVLEIGTANGGTLFLFSRVASEDATIISIDLPRGKFGGGYPKWRELLYKKFALPGQKIHLLKMDSHKEETLEKVKFILSGRKLDFLFIDGDHTYESVKRDFEIYEKLVEKERRFRSTRYDSMSLCCRLLSRNSLEGDKMEVQSERDYFIARSKMEGNWSHLDGMIAFHDIVPGPKECVGGVPQFWREIKDRYNSKEIVEDWGQGKYGIGICFFN